MKYSKQLKSFNLNTIATTSLVMFLVSFVLGAVLNLFLKNPLLLTGKVYLDVIVSVALLAVLLLAHELLHALGAMVFGKLTSKDIKFGVNLKQGMIYCHLKKPMKLGAYRLTIILPIIVTGIIPLIVCAVWGNVFLVTVFSFMVGGGAGDVIMFFSLTGIDKDTLIADHEKAPAYYLLYVAGKEPKNFVASTKEKEEEVLLAMKSNPFNGKSSVKVLLIAIFCALVVLAMYLVALFMKIF